MLGFVGVLSTDGILLDANAAALRAGGLSAEDVVGKPFWECYWWAHDQYEADRVQDAIVRARNGETIRYDGCVRMAGGKLIDIDFMLVPAFNDEGHITHLIPSELISQNVKPPRKPCEKANPSLAPCWTTCRNSLGSRTRPAR